MGVPPISQDIGENVLRGVKIETKNPVVEALAEDLRQKNEEDCECLDRIYKKVYT